MTPSLGTSGLGTGDPTGRPLRGPLRAQRGIPAQPPVPRPPPSVPDSLHPGTIQAMDFSFWYGPKQALQDVSITIPARAVTAFIGPSGCGKSTFLRSINRLQGLIPGARQTGAIELDGENIYSASLNPVSLRQRVGMVFQR